MAEDVSSPPDKKLLVTLSEKGGSGVSLSTALEEAGEFPPYVVKMARIGQETGTLEAVMSSLSDYYDKENTLARTIKNAVTYPMVMVFMLVAVLFIILTRVMPVFEGVYRQLGTEISPVTQTAVAIGSLITGVALGALILLGGIGFILFLFSRKTGNMKFAEGALRMLKEKSAVSEILSRRRVAAILSATLESGLDGEKALDMCGDMINHKKTHEKILQGKMHYDNGASLYEALKKAEVFSGLDIQMIKVGSRSGNLDKVFKELSLKFEAEVDEAVDKAIGRFEPTLIVVLAVMVGLILLAVMMPLAGIMASIG